MIEYTRPSTPAGFQTITLANTASVGTLTIPTDSRYARVQVRTQAVRVNLAGTPTSLVGFSIAANGEIELMSYKELAGFKAVAQANGAVLEILYYKI